MRIAEARLRRIIREALLREEGDERQADNSPGTKRKIFVLVGPPSVGKSNWIDMNFSPGSAYIISRDQIAEDVAESLGMTYDDMFHKPPEEAQLGDVDPKFGEVMRSPTYMTWQPLSYSSVLEANKEIGRAFGARVAAAADSGQDIIIDMTNMSAGARKNALAAIKGREGEFKKIAVIFPFEGAEHAVKRVSAWRAKKAKQQGKSKTVPPSSIDRMMGSYEPVSPAEGFDDVVVFDNRAKLRDLAAQADAADAAERAAAGGEEDVGETTPISESLGRRWGRITGLR